MIVSTRCGLSSTKRWSYGTLWWIG